MAFLAALPVVDELATVGGAAAEGGAAATGGGGLAAEAGGLISRGVNFVKGLLGGNSKPLWEKVGTSVTAHDIANRIDGGSGGGAPQHPKFGTAGYDGVPANLSSGQFNGL